MRIALGVLALTAAALPVFGAYPYILQNTMVQNSGMNVNGNAYWGPPIQPVPFTAPDAAGVGAIYSQSIGGSNPNDYEVDTTLRLTGPGGGYFHYVRASFDAQPGVGSYTSVELQNPTFVGGGSPPFVNSELR